MHGPPAMDIDSVLSWPVLALTAILGVLILFSLWKQRRLPPGPMGLPFVGYLPFIGHVPHQQFAHLSKRYGDVMSLNIGARTFVLLNTFDAMKEAYAHSGDIMGRTREFSMLTWIDGGLGVAQEEGSPWKEHRRFLLHKLRDLGFGKRAMEERIQEIVQDMVEKFRELGEKPYDCLELLSNCTCNAICSLILSKKYNFNDLEFIELSQATKILLKEFLGIRGLLTGTFFRYTLFRLLPGYKELKKSRDTLLRIFKKHLEEHEKTFDPANIRDYIDAFIEEMIKAKKENSSSTFTKDRGVAIVMNLFLGGTESVAGAIYLSLMVMMIHREVQERVQKELDDIVGRNRLPSLKDRLTLPYTEAVIAELQRYVIVFPLVPGHSNPEETTLCGYTIPRRSEVLGNIWYANRDPNVWDNPGKFNPNRFLDSSGRLQNKDKLILFSVGKRLCPGESLANAELYLYFTAILQNFTLRLPKGEVMDEAKLLDLLDGNRHEVSYRMCFIPR